MPQHPKFVWISGVKHKIHFQSELKDSTDQTTLLGKIQQGSTEIFISLSASQSRQKEVLLHEIVHGVIGAALAPTTKLSVQSEQATWMLGSGLFAVLTDPRNKPVLNFIFQEA